jgi:predicted esterase
MRRRRRIEWIWFGLVSTGLVLASTIATAVRLHTRQQELAELAARRSQFAEEFQSTEPPCPIRSGASVAPLRSISALAELNEPSDRPDRTASRFVPAIESDHSALQEFDSVGVSSTGTSDGASPGIALAQGPATPTASHTDATDPMAVEFDAAIFAPLPPTEPLRYDLFVPPAGARSAPLAIMLHGAGGDRAVWNRWAAEAQARGWIVCLPVATGNRGWTEVDVSKLRDLALQLVKALETDPKRVAIFGYSNGAFLAHEAALRNPDVFSAIVSIGGGCNVAQFSEASKQVGVYVIHGSDDRVVPIQLARSSVERLREAGLSNVTLNEIQGRGHNELFESEIAPVFDWIDRIQTESGQ